MVLEREFKKKDTNKTKNHLLCSASKGYTLK